MAVTASLQTAQERGDTLLPIDAERRSAGVSRTLSPLMSATTGTTEFNVLCMPGCDRQSAQPPPMRLERLVAAFALLVG
jgi:hypothetical protein